MAEPALIWDVRTSYELFASLMVLHEPEYYGVRAGWAAGMRSRLPHAARETLAEAGLVHWMALNWLADTPAATDAAGALAALAAIPPAMRLPTLASAGNPPARAALEELALSPLGPAGQARLREVWGETTDDKAGHEAFLGLWADPAGFGERYLAALRAYHELFFAEEELRVRPALERAAEAGRELAVRLRVPALLEELSQGLDMGELAEAAALRLAPSYWSTPIVIFGALRRDERLLLFGARPLSAALEHGEAVPDTLVNALKALADPTRLAILRDLAREPLMPTQLSRRLRLRTATISHHLKILRLAGLVRVRLEQGAERLYAARPEAVEAAFRALGDLLRGEDITPER